MIYEVENAAYFDLLKSLFDVHYSIFQIKALLTK
jgi:hypothetical protein